MKFSLKKLLIIVTISAILLSFVENFKVESRDSVLPFGMWITLRYYNWHGIDKIVVTREAEVFTDSYHWFVGFYPPGKFYPNGIVWSSDGFHIQKE